MATELVLDILKSETHKLCQRNVLTCVDLYSCLHVSGGGLTLADPFLTPLPATHAVTHSHSEELSSQATAEAK